MEERTVILNGKTQYVGEWVTYEYLVVLAGFSEKTRPTVTYRRKPDDMYPNEKSDGSMIHGHYIRVTNGMIFNVADTSNT